ncbi:type II secretion system protein [Roseimicrobium sp. ORNL1]|uniref:type II secretion system protein n=1 Tax=Roseimicrobium sp. ORNL1 TaxID=2711231 RepID=UPI0013E1FE41|nr:type II secretion system protein [Roseimicrobium sp. ORNL1]QIF04771.1 type II secretion system protein [Roseimicrobium sp. ORNL1]
MKLIRPLARPRSRAHGFTLIEISLVIGLMLGLITLGGFSYAMVRDWNKAKNASLALQAVYSAQRSYMADNPTADITEIDAATLIPYLPTGWTEMPTATSLTDTALTLDFQVMPPVFRSSGAAYDPSKSTKDGLWDIGG